MFSIIIIIVDCSVCPVCINRRCRAVCYTDGRPNGSVLSSPRHEFRAFPRRTTDSDGHISLRNTISVFRFVVFNTETLLLYAGRVQTTNSASRAVGKPFTGIYCIYL